VPQPNEPPRSPYADVVNRFNSCQPNEHKLAAARYVISLLNAYQLNPVAKEQILISIQNMLYNNSFP
jgi:hypothetical protein